MRPEPVHTTPAGVQAFLPGQWIPLLGLALLLLGRPVQAQNIIHGQIAHDSVWTEAQAPYILTGEVELSPDTALSIQPRATVRFEPGARLLVHGRLVADKAVFDGLEDLANREMIVYRSGSKGYLRHCILENLELNLETSDVAVTNNMIANRNGSGITVTRQAAPFISRNDFQHNSYFAVYKAGRRRIHAPGNYWGASDGPAGAGPGRGNTVNDRVDFRPFATEENGAHVLLKQYRLDRRECRPGDRLNLEFTLFNFNAFEHDMILGASLRREGQEPVHSAQDDLEVRVVPGLNVFTRPFRVPDNLPEGRYDVLWGVMKDDLSTYFALKKEFGALTVSPPENRRNGLKQR